ncbi:hypothetical protein ABTB07_22845, partial [Acinetobacter baumannii]
VEQQFTISKLALPTAVQKLGSTYGVAERGKQPGVISLNYQGTDKPLLLSFRDQRHFTFSYKDKVIFSGQLNSNNLVTAREGQ